MATLLIYLVLLGFVALQSVGVVKIWIMKNKQMIF